MPDRISRLAAGADTAVGISRALASVGATIRGDVRPRIFAGEIAIDAGGIIANGIRRATPAPVTFGRPAAKKHTVNMVTRRRVAPRHHTFTRTNSVVLISPAAAIGAIRSGRAAGAHIWRHNATDIAPGAGPAV